MDKSGLFALLGDPNAESAQGSSLRDMATHARIFYYAQRLGVAIDFAGYHAWLAQHPGHSPPNILPDSYAAKDSRAARPDAAAAAAASSQEEAGPSLPWQSAAPKGDLFIDRQAASAQSQVDQPAYPMAFAEMIKLLQEGKPVPGIRQIPNTVVRDPTIKPVGSRTVPKKPWERHNEGSVAGTAPSSQALDMDFPPVEPKADPASPEKSSS